MAAAIPQALIFPVNMESSIRVIIVNYNAGETITRCIQSVLAVQEPLEITVYDNASSDGSMSLVRSLFADTQNVEIVQGSENIGFSKAVNTSAKSGSEEYLLFLNPDCELLPGALEHLKQELDKDPGAALAGPLMVDGLGIAQKGTLRSFPDPWKSFLTFSGLWRLGSRFSSFRGVDLHQSGLPDSNTQAEAVSGACMLVRRKLFIETGGMDEGYGLHCEDLDLMYRLRLQGYHCLFVPAARVFHEQGVSSRSRPLWVHRQKHLGMQRFFRKFQAEHYSFPVRWLVIVGIWLRYAVTLPLVLVRN